MLLSQKLLHRTRILRRSRSHGQLAPADTEADTALPPLPLPPAHLAHGCFHTRPATRHSQSPSHLSASSTRHPGHLSASSTRHPSHLSASSAASVGWTSTASLSSSASSLSSAASTHSIEYDPLRLHPAKKETGPVEDYSHFDFGFAKAGPARVVNVADMEGLDELDELYDDDSYSPVIDLYASRDDEHSDYVLHGLSAPPPRHHTLAAVPAAAETEPETEPELEFATVQTATTMTIVRPRIQPACNAAEHYLKRGDWKRRGIVF